MFSEKQKEVFALPYSNDYDMIICDGAIRSGKSVACELSFILWAMHNFNRMNFAICGKTIKACERNVIKPTQQLSYWNKYKFSLSYSSVNALLTISRGSKVNYFYVFGGKDESSQDLVQGITLAGALFDEVALMPQSFVNQVIARCSIDNSKIIFNCNPSNPEHWFKKNFIEKCEHKRIKYLHFTMEDNPSLSEEKKKQYERAFEGVFYQRYILGKWVQAEGVIYRKFADNNERYVIDQSALNRENIWIINVGLDFGNNQSSHTMVATAISKRFKEIVVIDELKISESIDIERLVFEFINFCKSLYMNYHLPFNVRCDSAETTLINTLRVECMRNKLFYVNVCNAKKTAINERIALTSGLMAQERLKVINNCKELIKAFNSAVWDEKHPDIRLDIVGHNNPIDMLDAFEYSIEEFNQELVMN